MANALDYGAGLGGYVVGKFGDLTEKDIRKPLADLIADAGFAGNDAVVMRAIVFAESGARPGAVGHNRNGTRDVGLAQINTVHKGSFGTPADEDDFVAAMKNPVNNLAVSYQLYKRRGGFGDWVTYNNGRYRLFMPRPLNPIITVEKRSISKSLGITNEQVQDKIIDTAKNLTPIDELASAAKTLLTADTWARVGKGVLGGGLLMLGTGALVFVIASRAGITGSVAKAAKTAVTKGVIK